MTTASETPPAKERSKPPCWTTSNCPRPTMAMIAAKGRLPERAPQDRLDGANNRQARMSTAVEMTTVKKLFARGRRKSRASGKTVVALPVGFIPGPPLSRPASGKDLGGAEHVEGVSE